MAHDNGSGDGKVGKVVVGGLVMKAVAPQKPKQPVKH